MESAYGDDYYGQIDREWKTDAVVKQGLKEEIDTGAMDYDGEEEEGDDGECTISSSYTLLEYVYTA